MILIPALELHSGKVVRLRQSEPPDPVILSESPLETARHFHESGAMFLHVTDLDAAFGSGNNDSVLRGLTDASIPFQVGGGIRTAERAGEVLEIGADAVVMGTLFYEQPDAAADLVSCFGNRVIAALDVLDGEVQIDKRSSGSGHDLSQAIALLKRTRVHHVIYHCISSSDEDLGPDVKGIQELLECESFGVHTHCTIVEREDLEVLLELHQKGLAGVIVNQSRAEHSLNIERALQML